MGRRGEGSVSRYLRFYTRKVGKKNRRIVDVAYFYLARPAKGIRPFFSARVGMPSVINAVEELGGEYRVLGKRSLLVFGQDAFERLVVFAGVRQFLDGEDARVLLEALRGAFDLDVMFWYNAFLRSFEEDGYRGVRRVARAFRELYRL